LKKKLDFGKAKDRRKFNELLELQARIFQYEKRIQGKIGDFIGQN